MKTTIATWIAGNGQQVTVSHKTSYQNIADHTFDVACDEVEVVLGEKTMIYRGLFNDMIEVMGGKIRIPEEHQESIVKLDKEIRARRFAKNEASRKSEKEYRDGYNKIAKAMAE